MRTRDVTNMLRKGTSKVSGFLEAFRDFALKGSVIDMAVGIIIGNSFNEIVSSLVKDVISPLISLFTPGTDFSEYVVTLAGPVRNEAGEVVKEKVTLYIGSFFQHIIDFLIVAFALFIMIQVIYKLREQVRQQVEKEEEEKKKEQQVKQESQEKILRDIRDLLSKQQASQ